MSGLDVQPSAPHDRKRWRLILLLSLAVAVVAGGLVYRQWWLARPVGRGPAGPPVPREPFLKTWTDRKVLLLGMGDSVTAGFGASRGKGYFDRLVRNPDDEFPQMQGICLSAVLPHLEARNLAVSATTSVEHLASIRRLPAQDPDTLGIVVMTTGGNDLIHDYGRTPPREDAMYGATLAQARPWINNFQQRLHRMIDLFDERFPGGCHVFLADIYDPTDGVGDARSAGLPKWPDALAILAAYNDVIHRCAAGRRNVHLVPMHREFLGHGIHCTQSWRAHYRPEDPHYWYGAILEDPNDRGYDAVRRLFLLKMLEVRPRLQEEPAPPSAAGDGPHPGSGRRAIG